MFYASMSNLNFIGKASESVQRSIYLISELLVLALMVVGIAPVLVSAIKEYISGARQAYIEKYKKEPACW